MAGIYEGTDVIDKTFHGFRLDKPTGNLAVEIINADNPDDIIAIPDSSILRSDDYVHHFWSQDTIRFSFNSNGHLLMHII